MTLNTYRTSYFFYLILIYSMLRTRAYDILSTPTHFWKDEFARGESLSFFQMCEAYDVLPEEVSFVRFGVSDPIYMSEEEARHLMYECIPFRENDWYEFVNNIKRVVRNRTILSLVSDSP